MTTHVAGEPYPNLLKEKGGTGFPTLLILDEEGNILARQGERTVAAFETTLKAVLDLRALEQKAKAGDTSGTADIVLAKLTLGSIKKLDEAKAALAAAGKLAPEQRKRADGLLLALEMNELATEARKPGSGIDLGARCAEWFTAGKIPSGDATMFYTSIMTHAERTKDPQLFERAFAGYKAMRGNDERFKVFYATSESRLARLVRFAELTKKAKSGDSQAEFDLLLLRIEMGEVTADEAKAAIAAAKVGEAEKKAAEPWLLGFEVRDMLEAAHTPAEREAVQKRLAEMFVAGKVPKTQSQVFFMNVLMHAERSKDTDLLAKAIAAARERVATDPVLSSLVARYEAQLKKATGGDKNGEPGKRK